MKKTDPPRWFRGFSLRVWLCALSLLAMLPLLLFGGLSLSELDRLQRQSILDGLDHHARELSIRLDGRLQRAVGALVSLTVSAAAQRGDLPTLYDEARRLLGAEPDFHAITLIDADDHMVFVTALPMGADTFPVSQVDLAHEALSSGRANLSGPFVTPLSDKRLVAVSVPWRQHDGTAYVLRLVLLSSTLNRWLNDPALPQGWLASLVDRQGTVLARSEDAEQFVGQRASESTLQAMKQGGRFMYSGWSLDGRKVVNVTMPIHGGDWFLGVAVPRDLLEAPVQQRVRQFVLYALLGLLLSLGLSQWLARYLKRQEQALSGVLAHVPGPIVPSLGLRVSEFRELMERYLASRQEADQVRQGLSMVTAQRDAVLDLYDNAPCGYHSLDRQGRVLRINLTELGWLGYSRDEVLGQPFLGFLTESSQQQFRQNFPRFLECGQIDGVELELLHRDGSSMPVLISATAIQDGQGELMCSRSTVVDITERKRIEYALLQANDGLRRQLEAMEAHVQEQLRRLTESLEHVESADRARSALLAHVSHELRTPLNHISGLAYLLGRELAAPRQQARIEALMKSVRHLGQVIDDLIDAARRESTPLQLEQRDFDLAALLEDVARQARHDLEFRGRRLLCEFDAGLPRWLAGDGDRLRQVLCQLLETAGHDTEAEPVTLRAIVVARKAEGVTLRLEVEALGEGVSDEQLGRLFMSFQPAEAVATRHQDGDGTGLALCQRLIGLMGGKIGVERLPVRGCRFWLQVALPLGQERLTEADLPVAGGLGGARQLAERMEQLLADDDTVVLTLWRQSQALLAPLLAGQQEAFSAALEQFDFPAALDLLRQRLRPAPV